jgi:branched-chain amino acid transport system ATP-binding protein
VLCLEGIHTYYGQSHVLQGVSLEVRRGEVVALLGRNGAGKTTTMRTIIGLTPAREGTLTFRDIDLRRRAVHAIARLGVGYVPSGRRTFSSLTVRQNLLLSTHGSAAEQGAWTLERVFGLFPTRRTPFRRRAADAQARARAPWTTKTSAA